MTAIIVSASYREDGRFQPYVERLEESLREHWDGASLLFADADPPGSPPHREKNYAFKLHAVRAGFEAGHDTVIWFDSALYAIKSLDRLVKLTEERGYFLIGQVPPTAKTCVGRCSSDAALDWVGVSREDAYKLPTLACGLMGFNRRWPQMVEWMEMWAEMIDRDYCNLRWVTIPPPGVAKTGRSVLATGPRGGSWLSSDPDVKEHLGEEAIFSLFAFKMGMTIEPMETWWNAKDPILMSGYTPTKRTHDPSKPLAISLGKWVVPKLLGPEPVLDVGCIGFEFCRDIRELSTCQIHALDPASGIVDPAIDGVTFHNIALVPNGMGGFINYARLADPLANKVMLPYIPAPAEPDYAEVWGVELSAFMDNVGVDFWSMVKFNCEGAEYGILAEWPGPIARQILFQLHEHTSANPNPTDPDSVIKNIEKHLDRWYKPLHHVWESRHGAGFNYWDSLWVLK